jgi:hypothetical protein
MSSLKNPLFWCLSLLLVAVLAGCGTFKPEAKSWSLPKRLNASSGMIIGRLDFPANKTENPDGLSLDLGVVDFRNKAQVVSSSFNKEETYILDNNYFVVTNLKPGTYQFISFRVGDVHHSLMTDDGYKAFDVGPGQIKFVGSQDYIELERGLLHRIGKVYPYKLRQSQRPTELEMLQWLNSVSRGSGWESTIRKRIAELGG